MPPGPDDRPGCSAPWHLAAAGLFTSPPPLLHTLTCVPGPPSWQGPDIAEKGGVSRALLGRRTSLFPLPPLTSRSVPTFGLSALNPASLTLSLPGLSFRLSHVGGFHVTRGGCGMMRRKESYSILSTFWSKMQSCRMNVSGLLGSPHLKHQHPYSCILEQK